MNILAIGSHPDDIEFGCGGTLIKYAQRGHKIYLFVMSDASTGPGDTVRRDEQLASNKAMGVEEIFWGGYTDTQIPVTKDAISAIEEVIQTVSPTMIFAHYFDDTHQDHRNVSKATASATRYVKNALFYEGPTAQNFSPTVFVDIHDVLDKKLDALAAHASQVMKTNIEGTSILDIVKASATFRGLQGRVRNAEAFIPVRLFVNI